MKRPVIGTLSIMTLLGGGLYLGWNNRDEVPQNQRSSYGPAARLAIQATFDLLLSPEAREVYCFEEQVEKTRLVYARFDIPADELRPLIDQRDQFPSTSSLKPDPALMKSIVSAPGPSRPAWWHPEHLKEALSAGKSGRRPAGAAQLTWRLQMCAAPLSGLTTRVYLAFAEETSSPR